ncbi:unnamed protein product [Lymnaea stagnalis]
MSVRDRHFHLSLTEARPVSSVQSQLAEQKEWLKQHHSKVESKVPSYHNPHAWESSSLHSTGAVSDARREVPVLSTPPRYPSKIRLELDDQDEIRVRQY